MSIILKGIDLPEKENRMYMMELYADGHCSVAKIENGKCYELTIPSETEAIQIPKGHGRLIDGDKLLGEFIDWQYTEAPDHLNTKEGKMVTDHERQYELYLALGEAVIEIANAPTILDEEGK